MNQEEQRKIKDLIVEGELSRGLILLLDNELDKGIRQEAEILSSRLNKIEKRNREGILKEDDYGIEINKIIKSVMHLIDQEGATYINTQKEKLPRNQLSLKRLLLIMIPILIVLISAFLLNNLAISNKVHVSEDQKIDTTDTLDITSSPKEQNEKKVKSDSKPRGNQERKKENIQLPPTPKNTTEKLFNDKFRGTLAIVDLENKNGISNTLFDLLDKEQFKATASFFRSNFFTTYRTDFWQQGIEILEEISIPENLKCVCLVKEQIKYETKERLGHEFTTAKGEVELKILTTINGEATTIKIPVGGSGADSRRAYESFQSNFTKEFGKNNHLQKFELCKK